MNIDFTDQLTGILLKYVKDNQVIAVSNDLFGEQFCKKLALHIEENNLQIEFIPTSFAMSKLLSSLHLQTTSLNEKEIDLAFDFADSIDHAFNFIKMHSTSFVRDKMIALSATDLIIVSRHEAFQKSLSHIVPMEVVDFGLKKSVLQLENLGIPVLRELNGKPVRTETGNAIVDVTIDPVHSLEDINSEAKAIPGVLETGLFMDFADRVVLQSDSRIEVKSRLQHELPDNKQL